MSIAERLRLIAKGLADGEPLHRHGLTIVDQMVNITKALNPNADVSNIWNIEDAVLPMVNAFMNAGTPAPTPPIDEEHSS